MLETPVEDAPIPQPARKPTRLLFIALPVLVLGAGVAYWNFRSSTSGADSPQAAVERLVRAVSDEDPLGVLAALDPSEGDVLRDAYKPTADQAAAQGVVANKGDPLASVDVTATGMKYSVEQLGQRVAAVRVTDGTLSASFDPAKLPATTRKDLPPDFLRPHSATKTIADLTKESGNPLPALVTVKRNDGWYVSIFYTIAEGIRAANGFAKPDFDNPPPSQGADSPKGVLEAMATAIGGVDLDKGLQLLDPESLRVLVDYRAAIESQIAPADIAKARRTFSFALDGLEVKTTKLDDLHTRVDVTKLQAHGTSTNDKGVADTGSVTVTGTCYNATDTVGRAKPQVTSGCLKDTGHTFGLDSFFIVVAQRAGAFYFDPLRTLSEYAHVMTSSKDFNSLMCQASGKECRSS